MVRALIKDLRLAHITMNIFGPSDDYRAGERGPRGPRDPAGLKGTDGTTGARGKDGAARARGAPGEAAGYLAEWFQHRADL